ncbi:hypothetical protein [Phaeobacter porticola]|uniref:Uncharacterized protein n=1 Tax=Phaeobacter porticola TaxID=1844006 RepID=A0A1L3I5H5_9RHOB|nr:hypothetical protein [Phaeobacter porticola]APG47348.1 hypothetical protein PhaeoP97_01940 [Phaeobacter porticola]
MPNFNDMFELTVADVDLIETALQRTQEALADETQLTQGIAGHSREDTLRQIHDLLGRLHNQKIFYKPKDGIYVSG